MMELEKIKPEPRAVYVLDAANLDKFKWYVNILAWERMNYPKEDGPLSLMAGAKLVKINKTEISFCIAINPKIYDEIAASPEMKNDFEALIAKFTADNNKEYRFFPNSIKMHKMKGDANDQFFGPQPANLIDCFRKTTASKTDQDLLSIIKEDPKEDAPEPASTAPKDMLEALESEMREAKIIGSEEKEKKEQKSNNKNLPEETKNDEKPKKLRPQTPKPRRKPIIEEIPEKKEPEILKPE